MNVSLYVGPKFDQINGQFQKHVCNPMECILGADAGVGMKRAEFRPEILVVVAKGQNGNGDGVYLRYGVSNIDDIAVRGETQSFIACVRGRTPVWREKEVCSS